MATVFQVYRSIAQTKLLAITELGKDIEITFLFLKIKKISTLSQTTAATIPAVTCYMLVLKTHLVKHVSTQVMRILAQDTCPMAMGQYTY